VPASASSRSLISDSNARLAQARRLTRSHARRDDGRFLAEGAQPALEALRHGAALEVFATAEAIGRQPALIEAAERAGVRLDEVSPRAAAALSETSTPQGVVAVCRRIDVALPQLLARRPRLVAALVEGNDPGNAGTIVRTADAAGADGVIFVGGVDPYNGKAVRASAGSLFHLDLVIDDDVAGLLRAAAAAGLTTLATTPAASRDLEAPELVELLRGPALWLFGSEAHGLPASVLDAADERVRIPIHGGAESLNLAVAAGLCLYASAREQRGRRGPA
jgi:TrmH family RNA methyltransferase